MTRFLYRTGRWSALHPWRAISSWLAFTALLLGLAAGIGGDPQDDWNVPGAPAQQGLDLLRQHVPGAGNANARVVVHTDDGVLAGPTLAELRGRLAAMPHTVAVSPPPLSADPGTPPPLVRYGGGVTHPHPNGNIHDP